MERTGEREKGQKADDNYLQPWPLALRQIGLRLQLSCLLASNCPAQSQTTKIIHNFYYSQTLIDNFLFFTI